MDISVISFIALARRRGRADGRRRQRILTLTYLGAERVCPNYNVMGVAKAALEASVRYLAADLGPQGIRVNAISAGPMRTLAGSAIADARYVYKFNQAPRAAAPQDVSMEDDGRRRPLPPPPLSGGVTGEIHPRRRRLPRHRHAPGAQGQRGQEG